MNIKHKQGFKILMVTIFLFEQSAANDCYGRVFRNIELSDTIDFDQEEIFMAELKEVVVDIYEKVFEETLNYYSGMHFSHSTLEERIIFQTSTNFVRMGKIFIMYFSFILKNPKISRMKKIQKCGLLFSAMGLAFLYMKKLHQQQSLYREKFENSLYQPSSYLMSEKFEPRQRPK